MDTPQIQTASKVAPKIYAYTTPDVPKLHGWTKIGYTERTPEKRVAEQSGTIPVDCDLQWADDAFFPKPPPPRYFKDHAFHAYLTKREVERWPNTEWFRIAPDASKAEFDEFRSSGGLAKSRVEKAEYELRCEQAAAVDAAAEYFAAHPGGEYLWNAKPRFGKTLAAYELAVNRLQANTILIVTNRPAIANSWLEDYLKFVGQDSLYKFVGETDELKGRAGALTREEFANLPSPPEELGDFWRCIEFTSLQNLKGSKYFSAEGGFDKLREIADLTWDILIIDEAHEGVDTFKTDIAFDRIKRRRTLHLTGTPFKALACGKFPQDAIFNWTYADEQREKASWEESKTGKSNPYAELPRINLYTYKMSDIVLDRVHEGVTIDGEQEDWAFDLNEFFATNQNGVFVHDDAVDRFLDALTRQKKFPFSTPELRDELRHTFWLLNRVDSAKALARKLQAHDVFREYEIVLAAGDGKLDDAAEAGKSYARVMRAIREHDKTITLSVGQLTTGVTIPEWTAVMMLSNMSSPALYMQAAFRAQNPCLKGDSDGQAMRKTDCYVFDFDPARTLDIYAQFAVDLYSETSGGRGVVEEREKRIRELLNFFPVIGEGEGDELVELDAEKVLSIPQKIRAVAIVRSGFMSNFLFDNITRVFGAPRAVLEIIRKIADKSGAGQQPDAEATHEAREEFGIDDDGRIAVADDFVNGKAKELFGGRIYARSVETEGRTTAEIVGQMASDVIKPIVAGVHEDYGDKVKPSIVKGLEKKFEAKAEEAFRKIAADDAITRNTIEQERREALENSGKCGAAQDEINQAFDEKLKCAEAQTKERLEKAKAEIEQTVKTETIETMETKVREGQRDELMAQWRGKLRSFAATIPTFLMANDSEDVTLENFDSVATDEDFKDLTGISKDEFRMLRDGGMLEGNAFAGHLFSEGDFNAAVREFMRERRKRANWFDPAVKDDIFALIPNPKTNQIFTPRRVVKHMVDLLEKENPGCFDDPDKTFIDLYMKSGMFIAEIVKRLYNSEAMKSAIPDGKARLEHIFRKQVFGLAPTAIIHRIVLNYLLGFDSGGRAPGNYAHNFRIADAQKESEDGTLQSTLDKLYGCQTHDTPSDGSAR